MHSETQARSTSPGRPGEASGLPGGWQAAIIAALSALLAGFGASQIRGGSGPDGKGGGSRVAEVAPQDLPAALETVAGTPQRLAQIRDGEACSRRLAWVTIARAPGQPPGRIRLQSGSYISPAFELNDAPVRVALPYPASYATGRGVIQVVGTTTAAVVALTPPWHVPAQAGVETRTVTWTPNGACPGTGK